MNDAHRAGHDPAAPDEEAPHHLPDGTGSGDGVTGDGAGLGTSDGTDPGTGDGAALDEAGPAPLGVVRTPTGRPAVDALLDRLGDADHLTADGHLDVYEDVHRGLRAELTALDAPQPAAPRPYDNRS
ncbi:hypothetical protein RGF97_27125 [Streptomyces roseicoloratus]|uniref:Uncharacterized protein n=1 Tax=Streptomyces roseicoloratus TaxID=2508722 RepID=A0ABY9S2U0_9ACTN|nr:hypothetical protein [Streptomyces roseicoloratus]WMX47744.1 hypothetical protein RGF97_27125 [Streptomyces roseicoloratus]